MMPLPYSMPLPESGTPSRRLNFSLMVVCTHWPTLVGTLPAASAGAGRVVRSAERPSATARRRFIRSYSLAVAPSRGMPYIRRSFLAQIETVMARQFIYHMHGMSKAYAGGKKVLDNIHLQFYPDAKIGVLGPNGSGKSTLLKIMAGIDTEFTGEAWVAQGANVGYLAQEPQLDPALNVLGNVMTGVKEKKDIVDRYNELMMNYSDETADEATKLQDLIDSQNLWDLEAQVGVAMEALGCPPGDASIDNLSGGERRRVALCALLLSKPDLLLLDEPTNHLDAETTARREKLLREFPGAVLIVTHDRYFLVFVFGWFFVF